MKVAIGSDHAGFELKTMLVDFLEGAGLRPLDLGTHSPEACDYPPICINVAEHVGSGRVAWGIVLGGSGQGEQIAANKVRGIRAALCNDVPYAMMARRDNDANVLALGARLVTPDLALEIIRAWIATPFLGGRHARRIGLISAFEAPRRS